VRRRKKGKRKMEKENSNKEGIGGKNPELKRCLKFREMFDGKKSKRKIWDGEGGHHLIKRV